MTPDPTMRRSFGIWIDLLVSLLSPPRRKRQRPSPPQTRKWLFCFFQQRTHGMIYTINGAETAKNSVGIQRYPATTVFPEKKHSSKK